MGWLDATPVFLLISVMSLLSPSLRRQGAWRWVGTAWLAVIAATFAIAFLNPNGWAINCNWLVLTRTGVTDVTATGIGPCQYTNNLPLWIAELPQLIGIAILLGWAWWTTHPARAAFRTVGALAGIAVAIHGLAQVSQPAAWLFAAAVAAIAYAEQRRQRELEWQQHPPLRSYWGTPDQKG